MSNALIPFGAAIAADVLSVSSIPGGGTLSAIVEALIDKKRREATDILIQEISNGFHGEIEFDRSDAEPFVETVLRLSKAVSEGAARENLRMLAQIIAGLKKNKALEGDAFARWCGILEHLTRDELIVIGVAHRLDNKDPDEFWRSLKAHLTNGGYSEAEIQSLCASISRTGLLLPMSAWGAVVYVPSPWLSDLAKLADLNMIKTK
jgi:hypothetical protein